MGKIIDWQGWSLPLSYLHRSPGCPGRVRERERSTGCALSSAVLNLERHTAGFPCLEAFWSLLLWSQTAQPGWIMLWLAEFGRQNVSLLKSLASPVLILMMHFSWFLISCEFLEDGKSVRSTGKTHVFSCEYSKALCFELWLLQFYFRGNSEMGE